MGEECSTCRTCFYQHEIRSKETGPHIITTNNKKNIKQNSSGNNSNNANNIKNINNINNINNLIKKPKITLQQNTPPPKTKVKQKHKFRRKEGRKSTLDSISFNDQKKNEFEEELRISLNSMRERKNSSGYGSSGGGSFLSDDESSISISNKLFINDISEYLPSKKYKILDKLGSGSFGKVFFSPKYLYKRKSCYERNKKIK